MVIALFLKIMYVLVCACIIYLIYKTTVKQQNSEEYKQVEDLKRRIEELDMDNVDIDPKTGKAKILVPDIVDAKEATRVSTQKEECKEYEVSPNEKIEKTVLGTSQKDEIFENTEIERVEDKEGDDPIKEPQGFIGKILKKDNEE